MMATQADCHRAAQNYDKYNRLLRNQQDGAGAMHLKVTSFVGLVGVLALLGAPSIAACLAADWPQWRGPNRDGAQPAFRVPSVLPKALIRKWSVAAGAGHSSPIVVGSRVYSHARIGNDEVVSCLDIETGAVVWSQKYAAPYEMHPAARGHGKGPKSTPAVANGTLVTFGISGILTCWDANSGKQIWQKSFDNIFEKTSPLYGTAMSPLIDGSRCIVHVGGHDGGTLAAFDLNNGHMAWQSNDDGPGYSSPIVVESPAGKRLLFTQSQKFTLAVDVETGRPYWKAPFETAYVQNIVTPTQKNDLLVISGFDKGTIGLRLPVGDKSDAMRQAWHNQEVSMYMSSPVFVGRRLFGYSHRKRGQLFCLDTLTGKTIWTSDSRAGENAAIVSAGDLLLVLGASADLLVIDPRTDVFKELARYKVAETPVWAYPAVLEYDILVRDSESVARWSFAN